MKQSLKLALMALILHGGVANAANPVPGWYAGIMLGGSYAPKVNFTFINPTTGVLNTGKLSYSALGNIGGQVGYRFLENLRLEGQIFYNNNPYQELTVGAITITSPKTSTGLRLKGSTSTGAFMVNGFYDFFVPDGSPSGFSPYVGLGFGYAHVNNSIKFYNNNVIISGSRLSHSDDAFAAQGILGAGYFLDSFTWFGLDFRYFTTQKITVLDSRVEFASLNLSFSGMFNCA